MAATQDEMIAELQRANAELLRDRDAALAQRDAALAQRSSDYDERTAHQAATADVLKLMAASPGDPQPVFDLIVERARDLCDAYGASVWEFDGTLIHLRASNGVDDDSAVKQAVEAAYPRPIFTRHCCVEAGGRIVRANRKLARLPQPPYTRLLTKLLLLRTGERTARRRSEGTPGDADKEASDRQPR